MQGDTGVVNASKQPGRLFNHEESVQARRARRTLPLGTVGRHGLPIIEQRQLLWKEMKTT